MSDAEIGYTENNNIENNNINENINNNQTSNTEEEKIKCCSSKTNIMKTVFSILSIVISTIVITLLSYFYPDIFKQEDLDKIKDGLDSIIINKSDTDILKFNSIQSSIISNYNYSLDICDNNYNCLNSKIPIEFKNNIIKSNIPIDKLNNDKFIYLSEANTNMYQKLFYNSFYSKLVNIISNCYDYEIPASMYCENILKDIDYKNIIKIIKKYCITDTVMVRYYNNNKFIGNYFAETDIPEKIIKTNEDNIIVTDPLYSYNITNINIPSYVLYYTLQNIFSLDKYKNLSMFIYKDEYIMYKSTDKYINNRYFYNIDMDIYKTISDKWINNNKIYLINILKNIYEDIKKIGLSSIYIDELYNKYLDIINKL